MWWLFIISLCVSAGLLAYGIAPLVWRSVVQHKESVDRTTQQQYESVFVFINTAVLQRSSTILLSLSYVVAIFLMGNIVYAAVVPAAVAFILRFFAHQVKKRYQVTAQAQLPDFIQSLALCSQAGMGLQLALRQVTAQLTQPLRGELELCLAQQGVGMPITMTFKALQARIPSEGTQLLVAAIAMAQETGGRLSDVLTRLAHSLRTQHSIEKKVQALTAQAMLQAWLMAALPMLLLLVLSLLQPALMRPLWSSLSGWIVLCIIVVLEFVGLRWLQRMARIDI